MIQPIFTSGEEAYLRLAYKTNSKILYIFIHNAIKSAYNMHQIKVWKHEPNFKIKISF